MERTEASETRTVSPSSPCLCQYQELNKVESGSSNCSSQVTPPPFPPLPPPLFTTSSCCSCSGLITSWYTCPGMLTTADIRLAIIKLRTNLKWCRGTITYNNDVISSTFTRALCNNYRRWAEIVCRQGN